MRTAALRGGRLQAAAVAGRGDPTAEADFVRAMCDAHERVRQLDAKLDAAEIAELLREAHRQGQTGRRG